MVEIAPSILSADFARLGDEVRAAEQGGARRIHVDVMDGHFVPNLSMGPAIVRSLRAVTTLPLEVHLMVEDPALFIDPFLQAGADLIIVHHEVLPDPRPLLLQLHAAGKKAGLAIRPDTPVEVFEPLLPNLDLALCMTVYPGYSGQAFLPDSLGRIARLRQLIERMQPACDLEVDGGIDRTTTPLVVKAGANVLVAATAIFKAPEGPTGAVQALLALAKPA